MLLLDYQVTLQGLHVLCDSTVGEFVVKAIGVGGNMSVCEQTNSFLLSGYMFQFI